MRCIAVDDEPLALRIIEDFCQKVGYLDLAAVSSSAIHAAEMIKLQCYDLMFLDVNMPHLTGVDFVRMTDKLPMVIFTTAYPDYALAGFELDAVDYLLKPFSFDRFFKAVSKARDLFELKNNRPAASGANIPEYIMVRVEYSTVKINIADILFIEGLKDYIKIVTEQRNFVTKSSMKNIEERLPSSRFKRIHKSFIVNLDRVDAFENNHVIIGQNKIPLGNNSRGEFLEFLELNRL